jgi:hypothetical protein
MTPTLIPIHATTGCCGHLVECVNGYRDYDQDNKSIGLFRTPQLAVAAVLERAATGIPDSRSPDPSSFRREQQE